MTNEPGGHSTGMAPFCAAISSGKGCLLFKWDFGITLVQPPSSVYSSQAQQRVNIWLCIGKGAGVQF